MFCCQRTLRPCRTYHLYCTSLALTTLPTRLGKPRSAFSLGTLKGLIDSFSSFGLLTVRSVIVPCLQVYLKELERQKLQDILHKDVMRKIIFLQRWFRAKIERREFVRMREATILIQVYQNLSCVWAVFLQLS